MKKNFVLDTNVILFDADSIFKFEENDIYIPLVVIEEIDKFKKDMNETGRNARQFSRYIDDMRKHGSLTEGIKLNEDGGTLRVVLADDEIIGLVPKTLTSEKNDNVILGTALYVYKNSDKVETTLVSKDTNIRIVADAIGLSAEDYENGKVDLIEQYTGVMEVLVNPDLIDALYKDKMFWLKDFRYAYNVDPYPNQFIILRAFDNPSHTAIAKATLTKIVLVSSEIEAWGLEPRNAEQLFAMNLLLDDSIKLVTLVGTAGTGKTLVSLACGLEKVLSADGDFVYNRMLVSRPVIPMGRDIGFLPGTIEEKMNPWMQPIYDNLDYLLQGYESTSKKPKKTKTTPKTEGKGKGKTPKQPETSYLDEKEDARFQRGYQELFDFGAIKVEPLVYIRGRSIPQQYLIVDEAQNLTAHEIKTIITRAGEGTKIVLTGDPQQIDNPYVDASSNGLSYLVEKFKDQAIAGHVTFVKGERSELAEIASNIL